ncbi:MAG: DUF6717 family protein [Sphaerochaetaceae bacterium]|jgi:hypothetical protein|nr:hypothetical protein [Sphaerochaetaceae bacterium]
MKQTLHLYRNGDIWLFDDEEKDITGEPFVEGSSELITEIQKRAGLSGETLFVTFSDKPFTGSHHTLLWQDSRDNGTWNQYHSKELEMDNWLCPVLLVYFGEAPKKLFVKVG